MNLEQAWTHADHLAIQMGPYCERVEIAGSIRRMVDEVKDIEIVAVPRLLTRHEPEGLFGGTKLVTTNTLHDWALSTSCPIRWIKPGVSEIIDWQPKPDGKYWRGLYEGIKVDVFMPKLCDWGMTLLVRTGCADFSHAVAAHALRVGCKLEAGGLLLHGVPTATLEEEDAFRLLGLRYVLPQDRVAASRVRAV